MKSETQRVYMCKSGDAHLAERVIEDLRENPIAQLREQLQEDSRQQISCNQTESCRHRDAARRAMRELIRHPAEQKRRCCRRADRQEKAEHRGDDANFEVGTSLRPQIGQQHGKRPERRRAVARFEQRVGLSHTVFPTCRRGASGGFRALWIGRAQQLRFSSTTLFRYPNGTSQYDRTRYVSGGIRSPAVSNTPREPPQHLRVLRLLAGSKARLRGNRARVRTAARREWLPTRVWRWRRRTYG